jgi:hypothetical protein
MDKLNYIVNQSHPHALACLMDWGTDGFVPKKPRKDRLFSARTLMLDNKNKYLISICGAKGFSFSRWLHR